MFQYAFASSLAKENGTGLILDTDFYSSVYLKNNRRFTIRTPGLLSFPLINKSSVVPETLKKRIHIYQKKNINRILRLNLAAHYPLPDSYQYYKEYPLHFQDRYTKITSTRVYLDGYWQCEKYFVENRDELIQQFKQPQKSKAYVAIADEIDLNESVAVHIRREDYTGKRRAFSHLSPLGRQYYVNAISLARKRLGSPKFYFFSDDIAWAVNQFGKQDDFIYVSGNKGLSDIDEMMLMSTCRNQIIANSTFSWWAAWINENADKAVWAPDKRFGNRDIIPDSWHKVSII